MPDDAQLARLAEQVVERLAERSLLLSTAESCTGGWVSKLITDITGSSAVLDRGFVTYSNQAKQDMLGVPAETLKVFGAVSEETARAMVLGALEHSRADEALAITGIAGPGGGTDTKPVGTVFIAWGGQLADPQVGRLQFEGNREAVRRQAVECALQGLLHRMELQ
jgi:nicotinamide-nucleotide amidase